MLSTFLGVKFYTQIKSKEFFFWISFLTPKKKFTPNFSIKLYYFKNFDFLLTPKKELIFPSDILGPTF